MRVIARRPESPSLVFEFLCGQLRTTMSMMVIEESKRVFARQTCATLTNISLRIGRRSEAGTARSGVFDADFHGWKNGLEGNTAGMGRAWAGREHGREQKLLMRNYKHIFQKDTTVSDEVIAL